MITKLKQVLVTRPGKAGVALVEELTRVGFQATHLPVLDFAEPINQQAFKQSLDQLEQMDWLIFISPQSVEATRSHLPILNHSKIAAIGAGTAQALLRAGRTVDCIPTHQWNSEALLSLPEFQQMRGIKVAIVRGEGGREVLADTLQKRGAELTHVVAYRRVLPTVDIKPFINALRGEGIDVIIATSGQGVNNLKQLFGSEAWPLLKKTPLLVASDRIKKVAEELGFQTIWVAFNASHTAMFNALMEKRKV